MSALSATMYTLRHFEVRQCTPGRVKNSDPCVFGKDVTFFSTMTSTSTDPD